MALTRAQLLMGNSSQGIVLPNQVQGVKEGTGINIAADGTISVDEGDLTTFVRLNNGAAYNGYVWPGTVGANATFLMTDATGGLSWRRVRVPVDTATPTSPVAGEMWFDCATGQFKVYEACTTGTAQWTPVSQPGLPVLVGNTGASPGFTGGSGTSAAPYTCNVTTIPSGSNVFILNTVTITGLAPNQYVPIVDLRAVINGGRFSFTNNYANSSGTLVFQTVFKDQPASPAGQTYTANIKVGYDSAYISAQVNVVSVLSISNPGTITGTPQVGQTLTYNQGTATGGTGTYTYTWQWIRDSDNFVLQTGGNYLIPPTMVGEKIFVRLTATDTIPQSASANTDLFPANGVITKGSFPNPTPPAFPGEIGVDSCFTWDGPGTTLQSDGCIEFNVNGGGFSQTAKAVATGNVVCTRWVDTPSSGLCGDAPNGTTINGCIFDANNQACGSLTIDRVPSTFPPFTTVIDHVASTVATSNGSTPFGYNATSYVTGSLSAGASTLQGSIDGGLTWTAIPTSGQTFGINPGETLQVRFTTGAASNTTYVATINLGQSPNFTTQTFTVVNDAVPFPSTPINFPTFIPDVTTTTWNEAGTTSLTATGCIEMSTTGAPGSFSQSLSISSGNTLYTRWITSAACGDKASGPITGCIKGGAYEECDTLNINRVPTNFPPIPAVTGVLPGAYATSAAVIPTGTTAPSYLTTSAVAGVSNVGASIDGGVTWNTVPTSGTTLQVPPNTGVQFRFQGASAATTYTVPFRMGDGVSSVTQNLVVTTGKPGFPNTNISFPAYIPQVTTTTWNEAGSTVLTPSGCIQISLDGTTWTNPTETITLGATLYTRYNPSVACGGATSGPISGCVSSASNEECGTLTINRTPSNFPPITAVTGITPGSYGTSNAVSPSGFTAPAFVTVASVPAGVTNIEASTDGGSTWFGVSTATSAGAVINPDQSIAFQFKGASPSTTYSVDFRLGDGTNYVQQAFSVTTGTTNIPTADWAPSPSTGPNASPDTVNTATLKGTASGVWNGTVPRTLTATGALQININGGSFGSSVTATASGTDVIGFRWNPATIAGAADGAILTGTVTDGTATNTYLFTVSKLVAAGSLAFADLLNQSTTTTVTSAAVTPTGFNVPLSATFAGTATNALTTPLLSAGGLGFAASPVTVNPGDALLLRGTTGGTSSIAYGITINLGGQSDTWTATTVPATPAIATPAISAPSGAGAVDINPSANSPAGITLQTTSSYSPSGGAGSPQTSSQWEVYKNGLPSTIQSTSTISAVNPTTLTIGSPFGGGYFAGQIVGAGGTSGAGGLDNSGTIYNLIVAPVSSGGLSGTNTSGIQYKTSNTANGNTNAQNQNFGGLCTDELKSDALYPVFSTFINGATGPNAGAFNLATGGAGGGTGIGGYNDWYLPAKNELAVLYFFLKPDSTANNTASGSNPRSVAPYTPNTNYGPGFPNVTGNALFAGGAEAFITTTTQNYWSSSESSSNTIYAWNQYFRDGRQNNLLFASKATPTVYARAIRRVATTGSGSAQTLSINGANTDGFAVGQYITGSSSGATGIITAIDGTSVTITQTSSTNWNTTDKITGGGTAITGSPFNNTTSPFTSQFIPQSAFTVSSTYYARLRYRTSNATATDSAWSAWAEFSTASSFAIPPGTAMGGGYFGGQINDGGSIYNIIVAPKTSGSLTGQYGGDTPSRIQWKNARTAEPNPGVAQGVVYGAPETLAAAPVVNYPVFDWVRNSTTGPNAGTYDATNAIATGIGGYNDWYIPAKNELEICYRYLKPDTTANNTSSGANANAVPAATGNYAAGNPARTTSTLFQTGGAQAFFSQTGVYSYYWTSTDSVAFPTAAWIQSFTSGAQFEDWKNAPTLPAGYFARAIRRIPA